MKVKPIIKRKSFEKVKPVIEMPNLLSVQLDSYRNFLQRDVPPEKREPKGLQAVFLDAFPIEDVYGKYELQFVSYELGRPRYTVEECKTRGLTYAIPLRVKLRLIKYEKGEDGERKVKEIREDDVYFSELPLMTDKGTFIINGSERVVVTQFHRSPGVFFDETIHPNGKRLYSARMIPLHGSWLEIRFDVRDVLHVIISSRKKVPLTTLLRAFGYESDTEIISLFHKIDEINISNDKSSKKAIGAYCAEAVVDEETGEILLDIGTVVTKEDVERLRKHGVKKIRVVIPEFPRMVPVIFNTLKVDQTTNKLEAVREIYSGIKPGGTVEPGEEDAILNEYIFNYKRFDLGDVGRYQFNKRLGLNIPPDERRLTKEDFIATARYLIQLRHGKGHIDDIDHLGLRRARSVGELLGNQIRVGLARMARTVRERMRTKDIETMTPSDLINARIVSAVINSFFGSSQLSQFMDQTNPIAELTHKRRLSALGPGGLSRERAGFEVRDVHYTHYGRLCPIETPEGQNIGLITSLATYARINEFGFIETPYRRVVNRVVTNEVVYLTATDEDQYIIAQAGTPVDENGRIIPDIVVARRRGDIVEVRAEDVDFMDVSPAQLVGITAALIPFLEHDDASRALMGSNMQRQSVPLLFTEPPIVGTGLELKAAVDSGVVVIAKRPGIVRRVDSKVIEIEPEKEHVDEDSLVDDYDVYPLVKFKRTNQNTMINQRPLVKPGEKVEAGQIIADGVATKYGELALGRNVLVAFMSWHGYNFEDAVIISERLVRDDVYTSVHIEDFDMQVRETKVGPEELTRELPSVSADAVKDLDENGIVRVGAHVESGDILAGKVTPKGETELTPEMRLLKAVFGERAGDVKDTSLRVPPGIKGVVIDTLLLSRRGYQKGRKREKDLLKKLEQEFNEKVAQIKAKRDKKIREIIVDHRAKNIISATTGKPLIKPGARISKRAASMLNIDDVAPESEWTDDETINVRVKKILAQAEELIKAAEEAYLLDRDKIIRGDELPPGTIQLVKVNVAMKRKISIGDKMAGRHGNKGVVSIIVPIEDMPYLEDGTPVDIILNPLGVPSRMNIGQILETHLGWAMKEQGLYCASPVFNGATVEEIKEELKKVGKDPSGKVILYDGRTGEPFPEPVTVGYMYIMKLIHLADDKIHARSIGPYSLVTQQPLSGKAQFGGQRFGEMEVWALEAYGAAYTLQEMLTIKSDDVQGRTKIYNAIVKGENPPEPGIPESFNVLVKELQALCIDVRLLTKEEEGIE